MARFIINENTPHSIEVEAEKYGFGDGFVNFTTDKARVFSIAADRAATIRRLDE